jgi:DNA helicase II / ATP-dependent DNA helicase PcrA
MRFIADLHIHSHFSAACAKSLDLEHLYVAAKFKGINVVATGDATHPGWLLEIERKLIPAEPGLFKLNNKVVQNADKCVPPICGGVVRFLLSSEICCIYEKNGKIRKNHNLIYFQDIKTLSHFNNRLEAYGKLSKDGRPILQMDAKKLLQIVVELSDQAYLVPAHIWTPWYSLLGSKSGFNSIEECFEELTEHIFALETGLSSDPSMNQRVSFLDGFTLISNSDAHSPSKLGREANIFDTDLSFSGIRTAIKSGDSNKFLGTFEFCPKEGKYYLDGHRKCSIKLYPSETRMLGEKCPICGKKLTCGVLNRIDTLADRPESTPYQNKRSFQYLVPLIDILSEIFRKGSTSKALARIYESLISEYGNENAILLEVPIQEINNFGFPLLGYAISRMREGKLNVTFGYDGQFGSLKLLD